MVSDVVVGVFIQVGLVVLLCVGFTFTYQIEGFPNFAHIGFTLMGSVITFYMTKLMGVNPYCSWPISMGLCGLIGVSFYVFLVGPIRRRRDDSITLTIVFLALSIVIETLVGVFSYWVVISRHEVTRGFLLKNYDFEVFNLPGVAVMAPLTSVCLVFLLYFVFTRTKFGVAIRAVSEDEALSQVFGVNTRQVHIWSWFIVGALAGLSGSIITLWTSMRGDFGGEMLITVMAGSIMGGLNNVYGAVIGGVLITVFQEVLPQLILTLEVNGESLLLEYGVLILGFSRLTPILLIVLTLMLVPEGITGYLTGRNWERFLPNREERIVPETSGETDGGE